MTGDEKIAVQRIVCKSNSIIAEKRNRIMLIGMKWGNMENAGSVEAYHTCRLCRPICFWLESSEHQAYHRKTRIA